MKKLLLVLCSLLIGAGAWAETITTYSVDGRASSLETGKKYMIYNSARRWFLGANGAGSGYVKTDNTVPLTFSTSSDSYIWEVEAGSEAGTWKIKNVGSGTYSAGLATLGDTPVDYTIEEFSTCPASDKGGMASYNDDGTQTPSASITADDKTFYIKENTGVTNPYWNGSADAFSTTAKAHVYVIYTVKESTYEVDNKTPSIAKDAYLTVGEKVESFSPVTDASDNSKWYILTQVRGGETPMYDAGLGSTLRRAAANVTVETLNNTLASEKAAYLIRFFAVGEGTYNIQFANGHFITSSLKTSSVISDAGTYAFYNCNGGEGCYFAWNLESKDGSRIDNNAAGNTLSFWGSGEISGTSGNNVWYLYDTDVKVEQTVDVAYKVYCQGELVETVSDVAIVGAEAGLPAAHVNKLFTYTYDVETITSSTTEVTVTATWAGPFEISADFANAKWYYLKLKNANYPTYVADGTPNVTLPASYAKGDENAEWAFIGNPYTGLTIVNKAAGASVVLGSASPNGDGADGGNTYATLGTGQDYQVFVPVKSSHYENGFFLFTTEGYALNQRSTSNLAYWTKGYDAGSTFVAVEVVDDYAEDVVANIQPWFENAGGYFQLKSSVVDANQSKYEAAKVNCTLDTYNELNALIAPENMVYPETGYYRIKSSGKRLGETYIGYGTPKNSTVGLVTIAADDALNNPSTVIRMEATATTGVYKLSLQGLNVQNQTSNNQTFPATTDDGVEFTFIVRNPGVVAITNDFDNYGYLHESAWAAPAAVVRWTIDSGASQWTVEDATTVTVPLTTVGEASYATAYLPFGVTTVSGAAANVLELSANGKYVKAQAISEVPAGTGIVLIGAANAEPATLTIGDVTATVADNALTGHYVAGTVSDAYVLANGDEGLGFYALDGAQTVAANKAYIEKQADVKAILFGDEETGIESLTSATATDSAIYNMAGQRVSKAVRGLYIVGGKKVVVK